MTTSNAEASPKTFSDHHPVAPRLSGRRAAGDELRRLSSPIHVVVVVVTVATVVTMMMVVGNQAPEDPRCVTVVMMMVLSTKLSFEHIRIMIGELAGLWHIHCDFIGSLQNVHRVRNGREQVRKGMGFEHGCHVRLR